MNLASILASFWEPFGIIFRRFFGIDFWVPFWMPLFWLLVENGSQKSEVWKGRGGFWATKGPKGDPKASQNRAIPRDRFRIECPMEAQMPTRCPQDRQGHHFWHIFSGFRESFAIFEHNCLKTRGGFFATKGPKGEGKFCNLWFEDSCFLKPDPDADDIWIVHRFGINFDFRNTLILQNACLV